MENGKFWFKVIYIFFVFSGKQRKIIREIGEKYSISISAKRLSTFM